jgi:hypothetical protein
VILSQPKPHILFSYLDSGFPVGSDLPKAVTKDWISPTQPAISQRLNGDLTSKDVEM